MIFSVVSKVIFPCPSLCFKRSVVCFCYSNPVISTFTAFSSRTNHHYWCIFAIVTPKADLVAGGETAITLSLFKPLCCLVLTAIFHGAVSQAPVTGPNLAISKDTITCYFWSKCLSSQTVPCGLQQWRMTGVITARDLKLSTADQPKSWRDHVSIDWRISCCSYCNILVIPPVSIVSHPVLGVAIWKSCYKSPVWTLGCDVTVHLQKNNYFYFWSYNFLFFWKNSCER